MLCGHAPRIDTCDTPVVAFIQNAGYKASLRVQSERSGGVPPLSIRDGRSTSFRSALEPNIYYSRSLLIDRHAGALRFCLAAERIIRGGTRHCAALFPRASPLQKQSTGLFLNSPPARGIASGVFRRLRTETRTLLACRLGRRFSACG